MKKSIIVLLIISLINQAFAAFFAFVPIGMMWVYSMIIPLLNAAIYFIIFLLLIIDKHGMWLNIPLLLMNLFIPIYLYSAVNISTVGDSLYFWSSVFTGLYISILSVLILIFHNKFKLSMLYLTPFKIFSIVFLVVCIILTIISLRVDSYYYGLPIDEIADKKYLFYFSLYVYIALLFVYTIFVSIFIIRVKFHKRIKKYDMFNI